MMETHGLLADPRQDRMTVANRRIDFLDERSFRLQDEGRDLRTQQRRDRKCELVLMFRPFNDAADRMSACGNFKKRERRQLETRYEGHVEPPVWFQRISRYSFRRTTRTRQQGSTKRRSLVRAEVDCRARKHGAIAREAKARYRRYPPQSGKACVPTIFAKNDYSKQVEFNPTSAA